jgi:aminoglycoside 2''-phosphotransferase
MQDKITLIKEKIPNFTIHNYYKNEQGQNNDVLIINDEWVFRFPKYKGGIEQLKKETVIMDRVSTSLSIPVPKPEFKSFLPEEPGKVFTAYRLLPGSPLWREEMTSLEDTGRRQAAEDLALFLRELHSISVETVLSHAQHSSGVEEMEDLYKRLETKVFPFMKQEAIEETEQRFTDFFRSCQTAEVSIVHGDFGCSNILWDKERVSGIIDFGGAGIGDPAYDVAGLLASYGEEFINMMIPHYPEITSFQERVHFYKSTFALQEALFGIENGDRQAFENGLAGYKK